MLIFLIFFLSEMDLPNRRCHPMRKLGGIHKTNQAHIQEPGGDCTKYQPDGLYCTQACKFLPSTKNPPNVGIAVWNTGERHE